MGFLSSHKDVFGIEGADRRELYSILKDKYQHAYSIVCGYSQDGWIYCRQFMEYPYFFSLLHCQSLIILHYSLPEFNISDCSSYWSLSTDSRPNLKGWQQNFIWASLIVSCLKGFLIIRTLSARQFPSFNQNMRHTEAHKIILNSLFMHAQ